MALLNSERTSIANYEQTPDDADSAPSITLLRLAAVYVTGWRKLVVTSLIGGLLAVSITLIRGPWYTATATFVPETGNDPDLSSLAGLAGQLGVAVSGRSAPSPDFYAELAKSPVILRPIAADTFRTSAGTAPRTLTELLRPRGSTAERRLERATEKLSDLTAAEVSRRTGMISLTVRTHWRDVSISIAQRILQRLNDFNLRTRQSRGKAERAFAETQVDDARARLRAAEDAQRTFSVENRSIAGSPTLQLEYQRLAREVSLRQQLVMSLEESFEKARLREIQDTPVITILQQPMALSIPDSRGVVKYGVLGMMLGLMLSGGYLLVHALTSEARTRNDPDAEVFYAALERARRDVRGLLRRRTRA